MIATPAAAAVAGRREQWRGADGRFFCIEWREVLIVYMIRQGRGGVGAGGSRPPVCRAAQAMRHSPPRGRGRRGRRHCGGVMGVTGRDPEAGPGTGPGSVRIGVRG